MKEEKHKKKTQQYSTWGDKLLQHTDVLHSLQNEKKIKPITIQLSPLEICDSDCPFCSVADRPLKSRLPFGKIIEILEKFKDLGAKSLELTGGGNPMLYKDKYNNERKDINDIIDLAKKLNYDVGLITNTNNPTFFLNESSIKNLSWIRISLIKLDEGFTPEDYDLKNIPKGKLGFSYIIYGDTDEEPNPYSRTKKHYKGTTVTTIKNMARLVELNSDVKFVRIAGNCLVKGNNKKVRDEWQEVIDEIDKNDKFFIKDIGEDDDPYNDGCYVGGVRPYIAPNPHGDDYQVYICTSHVLNKRTYDLDYSLGSVDDIEKIWDTMSSNLKKNKPMYEVKNNCGQNWSETCKFCYYKFNNKLLHTVINEMPDKNFP